MRIVMHVIAGCCCLTSVRSAEYSGHSSGIKSILLLHQNACRLRRADCSEHWQAWQILGHLLNCAVAITFHSCDHIPGAFRSSTCTPAFRLPPSTAVHLS